MLEAPLPTSHHLPSIFRQPARTWRPRRIGWTRRRPGGGPGGRLDQDPAGDPVGDPGDPRVEHLLRCCSNGHCLPPCARDRLFALRPSHSPTTNDQRLECQALHHGARALLAASAFSASTRILGPTSFNARLRETPCLVPPNGVVSTSQSHARSLRRRRSVSSARSNLRHRHNI